MSAAPPTYLQEILSARERRRRPAPPSIAFETRPFGAAILASRARALIAEVKVASPSRGELLHSRAATDLARAYERAGAAAISVVTEESRFRGSLFLLQEVRAATSLPVLRKDFLTLPEDLDESAAWGASAILLIARILDDEGLAGLLERARALGLDALVEVHDRSDLERAQAANAAIIGVNNRDLETFRVDLSVSETLAPLLPSRALKIAESGIGSAKDVARLARSGYQAFLVGEALLLHRDPEALARELVSAQ